ncbi:hypothetical protein ACFL6M_03135 [Candidatus Eisenbacteria bacterium]|uniref:Uncharacterized protein n=1 Tax=Eiseniibacteriota bacterium TaxID=2212470 RepID=A0ABV6YJQ0_UNCEI
MKLQLILVLSAIAIFSLSCGEDDHIGPEHHFNYGPAVPERGDWSGTAEFGELEFGVNDLRTAITRVFYYFQDWQCGAVIPEGLVSSESQSGWLVSDAEFTIEHLSLIPGLTLTIHGTFTTNDSVIGTWTGVTGDITCSGDWQAKLTRAGEVLAPGFTVLMSADFTRALAVDAAHWPPGSQVTLEIDNDANGSIDFESTMTADNLGGVNFRNNSENTLFTVAEGDIVKVHDDITEASGIVLYATVEMVDTAADVLSGFAREGTILDVRVFDPSTDPFPDGPELAVEADSNGRWRADFSGIADIIPESDGWVIVHRGYIFIGW